MELKDVILSTLAELEELSIERETATVEKIPVIEPVLKQEDFIGQKTEEKVSIRDDEARILDGIRERLLVLFEGFQSPNNVQIEAKVDLTLNFLEYLLATIDSRLETIKEK
jgi:hypothetical protein